MTTKWGGILAALAFTCATGIAAAQQTPPGPDVIKRLIAQQGISAGPAANRALSGGGATLDGPGNTPTGWNVFHATNCEWYTDGTNNYLFVFPQEGGYWYVVNNIYVTDTFETGCVNGNYEATYVVNSTTGAFTNLVTYPYK
jgi:hypothetical protein